MNYCAPAVRQSKRVRTLSLKATLNATLNVKLHGQYPHTVTPVTVQYDNTMSRTRKWRCDVEELKGEHSSPEEQETTCSRTRKRRRKAEEGQSSDRKCRVVDSRCGLSEGQHGDACPDKQNGSCSRIRKRKWKADSNERCQERDKGCGLPEEQCSVPEGQCSGVGADAESGTFTTLPGRRAQMQLLVKLLSRSFLPPCVYVHGPSSSGKTLTVSTVLSTLKMKHAMVNCRENYCPELLLTEILKQLSDCAVEGVSCSTMHKFISLFKQLPCLVDHIPVCIVLDNAEWLVSDGVLLTSLKKLSELCGSCKVCVVIISGVVVDKFFLGTESLDLIPLHFPQYSKEEILEIMKLDCPSDQPRPFFQTFVHHIWNVFHIVSTDLYELRQLSSTLWPKYVEPVKKGEVTHKESRQLWRCIEPYFRTVMSRIYLRDTSLLNQEGVVTDCSSHLARTSELPTSSKYLLIASFLASYNPSKTDRRIFSKLKQSKHRKSHRSKASAEHTRQQLLGPKEFSLDRMMAILCSIVSEAVVPTAHLHAQVSMLVSLRLLSQCSKSEALDVPKYKCLLDLALTQQLSRSVDFDLIHHLHDFNA